MKLKSMIMLVPETSRTTFMDLCKKQQINRYFAQDVFAQPYPGGMYDHTKIYLIFKSWHEQKT